LRSGDLKTWVLQVFQPGFYQASKARDLGADEEKTRKIFLKIVTAIHKSKDRVDFQDPAIGWRAKEIRLS
jgi:hypothetical protein